MSISESQFAALKQAAVKAAQHAWCPYSNFPVGAAVLTNDGQIFAGCNVENASHGLTICAERNAMAQAVSAGCREFTTLLIYTATKKPTAPCGVREVHGASSELEPGFQPQNARFNRDRRSMLRGQHPGH